MREVTVFHCKGWTLVDKNDSIPVSQLITELRGALKYFLIVLVNLLARIPSILYCTMWLSPFGSLDSPTIRKIRMIFIGLCFWWDSGVERWLGRILCTKFMRCDFFLSSAINRRNFVKVFDTIKAILNLVNRFLTEIFGLF